MRFLFFLFGLLLAGCILSCWTYVEKYLEFFPSLPWCVCLQLNVIFSTNMWPVLTKLFPASVCWAVKNVKFSEQHLSEPDFWVFLKQRISVWWKYTRTDTLWNLIFFFCRCVSYVHTRRRGTRVSPMASTSPVPTSGCQQAPAAPSSWLEKAPPCCGGRAAACAGWPAEMHCLAKQNFPLSCCRGGGFPLKLPIFTVLELCIFATAAACQIEVKERIQKVGVGGRARLFPT